MLNVFSYLSTKYGAIARELPMWTTRSAKPLQNYVYTKHAAPSENGRRNLGIWKQHWKYSSMSHNGYVRSKRLTPFKTIDAIADWGVSIPQPWLAA